MRIPAHPGEFPPWLQEPNRCARWDAKHLLGTGGAEPRALNRADRVRRKILLAPALVFGDTLLSRGLILDGWPGWYYVFQRTLAELVLALSLMEQKLKTETLKR